MDVNSMVTLISNIGVPCAIVIPLMYFIKYMYDGNKEQTSDFCKSINALKASIDILITKLDDGGVKDESK